MGPVEFDIRRYRSRPAPQGRVAEPPTGTSHASLCLIVRAGTTRDSEPLLPSMTRTGTRCRTRSLLSHEGRPPDPMVGNGDTPAVTSCLCRAPHGVTGVLCGVGDL